MNNVATENPAIAAAREMILQNVPVLPIGGGSKAHLSGGDGVTHVSSKPFARIVQYEPSEFTITAGAGTTLAEVTEVLAGKGQYLPFDPMLAGSGATLGGTIAAGLSGPGRFRFGGLRDFLLGATVLLGNGDLVHTGGKVVKNAAGFDIPKLMIGSLGRLGLITEVTLKVFPRPIATQSLRIPAATHHQAMQIIAELAGSTWELDAIDYIPEDQMVWIRVGGPVKANQSITVEIAKRYPNVIHEVGDGYWNSITEMTWAGDAGWGIVKAGVTAHDCPGLIDELQTTGIRLRLSAAANIAWIAFDSANALSTVARSLQKRCQGGLVVRDGDSPDCHSPVLIGNLRPSDVEAAISRAFDPDGRFPSAVRG